MLRARKSTVAVVCAPASDERHCWICQAIVAKDEPTIAPTVCARCYDALVAWWR